MGINESAKEKILLAMDVDDLGAAARLLDRLDGELRWVKIGLQLFTAEGPRVVQMARERGLKVFLDLKFHDIPNTVQEAVASAARLGVSMATLHLAGGPEMVRAALREAGDVLLLGVTVLTSMDEEQLAAVGVPRDPAAQVVHLAAMGQAAGLRGVVASPREIRALREACGDGLCIVTPGVRPAGAEAGDQKRIATPSAAIRDGADYLVVGRPISGAADPRAAFLQIAGEISSCL